MVAEAARKPKRWRSCDVGRSLVVVGSRSTRSCPSCGATYEDPSVDFCRHDGARLPALIAGGSSQPAIDPLLGAVIAGRFRITELLGRGGMGAVYAADHLVMKRRVALKILRAELSSDPTSVARFEREARAASRIESAEVVRLFDFGRSDDGLLYIAMEHLDGESLATRLDRDGALSPAEAVRVAIPIARALDAAHRAHVVHRDLKPDNVMLLRDGSVRVLDFGIARILEDDPGDGPASKLTQAGSIIGTPMYMSPEAAGRTSVGPPADLYALGVMLFEMLVGRPPFDDPQPVLLMGMHLRVPPELVREARPGLEVPDALEELVDRLLSKEPEDRPVDARAALDALEQLHGAGLATATHGEASQIVAARAERRRTKGSTQDDRRRTERGGAAVASITVDGATPGPISSTDPTPPPPSPARARSRWPVLGGLSVLLLAALGASVWATQIRPSAHTSTTTNGSTHDVGARSVAPPARTLLRFDVVPRGAEVIFDGRSLPEPEVEVDRSARSHDVVVRAAGYRSRSLRVRGDVHQTVPVELELEEIAAALPSTALGSDAGTLHDPASRPADERSPTRRGLVRGREAASSSTREPPPAPAVSAGSVDDMFRRTKILRREGRSP